MNKEILSINTGLFAKVNPDTFSYVKLYADTDNPEYYLANTIITDEWFEELKIFNDISIELQPEKYNERYIINYIDSNLSGAFKILYTHLLTGNVPIFTSLDGQLEYLLILNQMINGNKIRIIMDGLVFDNKLWEKILDLNINFKDFLPDYYKLLACHHCLSNPDIIPSVEKEHEIIDFLA